MAAITSAVIAGAGVAMSFYGQHQQAKAAESTARYNASIQRDQATRENMVNAENLRRKTRENNRLLAQVRANTAAKGLSNVGTPLAVLGETAFQLEREINDLSYEASTRYQSLAQGAKMSIWEGQQTSSAIKTAATAGLLKGAGSTTTGYLQATGKIQ
jgi:rubrerythrin